MRTNEHLTSAEVYFEDGIPYIKLEYEYESDDGTHKIAFPKVEFPFSCLSVPTINTINDHCYIYTYRTACLSKGNVEIKTKNEAIRGHKVPFLDAIIKKKARKMTLEEIEKKLGYPVKIVNKDGKND